MTEFPILVKCVLLVANYRNIDTIKPLSPTRLAEGSDITGLRPIRFTTDSLKGGDESGDIVGTDDDIITENGHIIT
jgi:hypothetical protein